MKVEELNYNWTFKFHKVVRQHNSGAVEDFTVFRSLFTNPKVKELLKSVHIAKVIVKNKSGTFITALMMYIAIQWTQLPANDCHWLALQWKNNAKMLFYWFST